MSLLLLVSAAGALHLSGDWQGSAAPTAAALAPVAQLHHT